MSRSQLTGSQTLREKEILNKWLSFESLSNEEYAISGVLYTVPLGQINEPYIVVSSGSYTLTSGSIQIEKEIHFFEREQEASLFITEIGLDHISLVKEKIIDGNTWTEIHLINYSKLKFDFEIEDLEERNGYRMEIFKSSSFGYVKAPREVKKDSRGNLISDTYLRYFDIEVDK